MPGADVFHFQGHVSGQGHDKHLVLDLEASLEAARSSEAAAASRSKTNSSLDNEQVQVHSRVGKFMLQDAYAVGLRA